MLCGRNATTGQFRKMKCMLLTSIFALEVNEHENLKVSTSKNNDKTSGTL